MAVSQRSLRVPSIVAHSAPASTKEYLALLSASRAALAAAASVVIVGGGACGIELSGEVKDAFPACKVFAVSEVGSQFAEASCNHCVGYTETHEIRLESGSDILLCSRENVRI
jgi:hypothetical protein